MINTYIYHCHSTIAGYPRLSAENALWRQTSVGDVQGACRLLYTTRDTPGSLDI